MSSTVRRASRCRTSRRRSSGRRLPAGRQAINFVTEEESGITNGATILVTGARVTRGGAAFANSEMMLAGGKWDTFRMLTHPGTAIIPGALAAAESQQASGRDFITAIAAGYEVMERMAADWIPTVMARGFHAGPVFSIFGAAIAAAKIMRFDRGSGPCGDLAVHQPGGEQPRKPCASRRRRGAQRHARRRSGEARAMSAAVRPCSKVPPASITLMRATTPES